MKTHNKIHSFTILFLLVMLTSILPLSGCSSALGQTAPAETESISDSGLLKVHFIDVGQGDSILIQSGGHAMLIDAGLNDQGEIVADYLRNQGVKNLDYVVGTHPDADHIGGLDDVLHSFDVKEVFLPPKEHTTRTFEDVLDAVEDKNIPVTFPEPGDEYSIGNADFTIVAPNSDYGDDLNNWSIGIHLYYGSHSFLFCGDAETDSEKDMCQSGLDINADVLKLSHHGSSTSSSDIFLDAVNPSFAVISCGKDNSYGHPHRETMAKMEKRNITVFRTDEQGTIVAATDGKILSWSAENIQGNSADHEGKTVTESSADYILNTNSRKFHLPSCPSADQISDKNRQEYTGSRKDLLSQNYEPCKNCNP